MNPLSMPMLATLFAAAGVLVGAPSIAMLVFYALHRLTKSDGQAAAATDFGSQPDAMLLMLKGITQVLGALAGAAAGAAQFLFNAMAAAAALGLVWATLCWLTSRGLVAHAPWARISAGGMLTLVLLPSMLLALPLHGLGRLVMLVIAALCLLALHTVWTGYAVPAAPWAGR